MSDGEFIRQRLIEHIIPEVAAELGVECKRYSRDWVFQLVHDDKQAEVFGYKFSINNAAAAAIADDKVATSAILASAGVACVSHTLVYNRDGQIESYDSIAGRVVAKPLSGTSGVDVEVFDNQAEAERYVANSTRFAWALSPYLPISREIRCIILDGATLVAYEKRPTSSSPNGVTMYNLGLGAVPIDIDVNDTMRDLALKTIDVLHLRVAAVDIVEVNGEYSVLEVNSGIMMEHYMRIDEQHYARGREVYKKIIEAMLD